MQEKEHDEENKLEPIDDQSLADQDNFNYAWCEGDNDARLTILLLPYERYIFWCKLIRCKTWGEIRAICDGELCETLVKSTGRSKGMVMVMIGQNWVMMNLSRWMISTLTSAVRTLVCLLSFLHTLRFSSAKQQGMISISGSRIMPIYSTATAAAKRFLLDFYW